VVLPFDPTITDPTYDTSLEHPYNTNYKYDDNLVKYYLEYAKSGGNLIVLDSEYNYDSPGSPRGLFSKLLSINPDDFTSSIEKKYGNGKIIFVNTTEYFDDISKESPQRHNNNKKTSLDFMTLRNISGALTPILGASEDHKYNSKSTSHLQNPLSNRAILGNLEASGKTTISSSSILFPNTEADTLHIYAKDVTISNDTQESTGLFSNSSLRNQGDSEAIKIERLKLYSKYGAVVDLRGTSVLPTTMLNYDYVMMSLGNEFNMTLSLHDGAYADISLVGEGHPKNLRIQNATLHFYNMTTDHPDDKFVPLLFKNPSINTTGSASFREYKDKIVNEIRTYGSLTARYDHGDHYYSDYHNGNRIEFISYLQDSQVKGESVSTQNTFGLKLPGGLSESWENEVQWPDAAVSINSIITATLIVIISILIWPRRRGSKKEAKTIT
jgi:hypothetical protein